MKLHKWDSIILTDGCHSPAEACDAAAAASRERGPLLEAVISSLFVPPPCCPTWFPSLKLGRSPVLGTHVSLFCFLARHYVMISFIELIK